MALQFSVVNLAKSAPVTDLDSIPESVRAEVEEAWSYFSSEAYTGDQGLQVAFADKAAKVKWVKLAQDYTQVRPADKGERLNLRVSPMRGLPDNVLTFRMRTQAEADKAKADAKAIREATAKANGQTK